MKGIVLIVLAVALFFSGALYGIEKNQQKETGDVPVEVTSPDTRDEQDCLPPESNESVPWISRLAEGIGEGIAVTFNGIVVVFSEMFSF
ncbi:hypothetical protein [Halobacillus salinus]|uniref:hypothetical protein n=1 Tax=Halobacillus salinus TaxID=192814 RepID=UPI0009A75B3D|nr:hypothetical protein [Halobacillus salinus]